MNKKNFLLFAVPSVVLLILSIAYCFGGRYVSTDNARIKIANIQVVSDVSGYIESINIKNNTNVKRGDVLIQIDKTPYLIVYNQQKADFDYYSSELVRKQKLRKNGVISESEIQQAIQLYKLSKEKFEMAEYKLNNTTIRASSDGIVTNFDINIGDYINERKPLFNIIDHSRTWVEADFKETELSYVKAGQMAEIKVDALPNRTWKAKVVSINPATAAEFSLIPAQNTSANWIKVVQRIKVILEFYDVKDYSSLASGMSIDVVVDTDNYRIFRKND